MKTRQSRYERIMAALDGGEPYSEISKRFRMTARDVWVYDHVLTRGHPREKAPKQTAKPEYHKQKKFVFSEEVLAEADVRHKAGETIIKIAESLHTSDTTLARAMKDAGYDTASIKTPNEVKRQIVEDFLGGLNFVRLKAKYHMCSETLRQYIRGVIGVARFEEAKRRHYRAGQARNAAGRDREGQINEDQA